eukprot:GFYU01042723.1.p1 GENE.GFYU01042723.1~~GFYU01042723.1.p1  ORF type:complete len:149 (-),score=24.34 GFYU01042723.1:7-453(-)
MTLEDSADIDTEESILSLLLSPFWEDNTTALNRFLQEIEDDYAYRDFAKSTRVSGAILRRIFKRYIDQPTADKFDTMPDIAATCIDNVEIFDTLKDSDFTDEDLEPHTPNPYQYVATITNAYFDKIQDPTSLTGIGYDHRHLHRIARG